MQNQNYNENQQNLWTVSEKDEIAKVLTILINGQKTYGKDYSLKDTFAYYQLKLENKFTAKQVIYALDKYTDFKADIPTPADIILILTPVAPKVTEAQHVAAQKAQERNGYPQFSIEAYTIREYQMQNADHNKTLSIENQKIRELAGGSIKRIEK